MLVVSVFVVAVLSAVFWWMFAWFSVVMWLFVVVSLVVYYVVETVVK